MNKIIALLSTAASEAVVELICLASIIVVSIALIGFLAYEYSGRGFRLTKREKELLEAVKSIQAVNPTIALTGTLMLKLRGIKLPRKGNHESDIDLVFPKGFNFEFTRPLNVQMEISQEMSSCEGGLKYFLKDGTKVDFLPGGVEKNEYISGVKCAPINGLIEAKMDYAKSPYGDPEKHIEDLQILKKYYKK